MKLLIPALIIGAVAIGTQNQSTQPAMHDATAATYEHLATAIIEIRATENNLVRGILLHHEAAARQHLERAAGSRGTERVTHLESAATEIAAVAQEGDKRVQAVRQRLLKAGHHHHTDAETQEDYIFIDSAEKKELLQMATRVSRIDPKASAEEVLAADRDLQRLFERAIREE